MATQTEELEGILNHVKTNVPKPISSIILKATDDHKASFDTTKAIKPGATLPSFTLSNAVEKQVSSSDLLAKAEKGLLITFYRGEWCPYCNIALSYLQKNLPEFEKRGVQVIAISPELPNTSITTAEKHALKFEVLSDAGNVLARQLGIVWKQFDELKDVSDAMGVDQEARNGDNSRELPVPTTLLVDKSGLVRNVHLDPDWSKRLEPSIALEWADKL